MIEHGRPVTRQMFNELDGAPLGPADVAATMFAALGVDPAGHYHDLNARPYAIADGKPIAELYR